MKKIALAAFSATALLALSACGGSSEEATDAATDAAAEATDAAAAATDAAATATDAAATATDAAATATDAAAAATDTAAATEAPAEYAIPLEPGSPSLGSPHGRRE